MSIISIFSTNPKLSYILAKNPQTIRDTKTPFTRELRAGKIYGWFTGEKDGTFRLLFIDADASSSFAKNPEFEYLDMTRYSDPYLVIMMLTTALSSALKTPHEEDKGFDVGVKFTLRAPSKLIKKFENMLGIANFIAVPLPGSDLFWDIVLMAGSVMEALNMVCTLCAIISVSDYDNTIPLPEAGIIKYLGVLNKANAPYYLRHLFVSRAISNDVLFARLKDKIDTETMQFRYGNTQVQRLNSIKNSLANSERAETLVDLGCGEMTQSIKLLSLYSGLIGIDADENIVETCTHRIRKKGIETATVVQQKVTGEWLAENEAMFEDCDFLLSEVIEHMPIKEAEKVVTEVLKLASKNVLITVPNREFNKFYGLANNEMRHPEHIWEPTLTEFRTFIVKCIGAAKVNVTPVFGLIGDTVVDEGLYQPTTLRVQLIKG